jgi:hypothetical protein
MQPTLPKVFISIGEAVQLINSDTRADAKVDTKWLVSHIDWIEDNHNFRIPLMKTTDKGDVVKIGSKYVEIRNAYERETIKKAIRDHYRDMVGRHYAAPTVKSVPTVADEEESGGNVTPRRRKPIAKEGAIVGTGETQTTNGANL